MYDNGLLSYYKNLPHDGGYIDADAMGLKRKDLIILKTTQCTVDNKRFYLKVHNAKGTLNKPQADAEILLSQIYSKLGLPSAIYLPARSGKENFLICDDIEKPNVVLATNYLLKKVNSGYPRLQPFLSRESSSPLLTKYFTQHALSQQTKLRICDTATFNTDRHFANFFYSLQHSAPYHDAEYYEQPVGAGEQIVNYFRSVRPNKVEDVVAIDFESSGGNASIISRTGNRNLEIYNYISDFKLGTMSREEMLTEFSTNPKLDEVIDKQDFAEELGSLDVAGVAEDIKETIDYEVDKKFVDVISQSCEEVAESLMK